MWFSEYIKNNKILSVGSLNEPKCICVEIIVKDPKEFVKLALDNECYVPEILWFDRVSIDEGSILGGGGPRDPRESDRWYFAETYLHRSFTKDAKYEDFCDYFDFIKAQYPECDLYPAIDVYRK